METFCNFIFPALLILAGALTGYKTNYGSGKNWATSMAIYVICHILLILFPLGLVETGRMWTVAEIAGRNFITTGASQFSGVFVNIILSWFFLNGLIYVVGACIDIKKEFRL